MKQKKKKSTKSTKKPVKPTSWQMSKAVHPGQVLLEQFLAPKGTTQAMLTEKLGWKLTRLNKLINGKGGVTAASALDLSRVLHTKPEFWLDLQVKYDLLRAKESVRQHR